MSDKQTVFNVSWWQDVDGVPQMFARPFVFDSAASAASARQQALASTSWMPRDGYSPHVSDLRGAGVSHDEPRGTLPREVIAELRTMLARHKGKGTGGHNHKGPGPCRVCGGMPIVTPSQRRAQKETA